MEAETGEMLEGDHCPGRGSEGGELEGFERNTVQEGIFTRN